MNQNVTGNATGRFQNLAIFEQANIGSGNFGKRQAFASAQAFGGMGGASASAMAGAGGGGGGWGGSSSFGMGGGGGFQNMAVFETANIGSGNFGKRDSYASPIYNNNYDLIRQSSKRDINNKDKRFQNMAIFEHANIGSGNFGKREINTRDKRFNMNLFFGGQNANMTTIPNNTLIHHFDSLTLENGVFGKRDTEKQQKRFQNMAIFENANIRSGNFGKRDINTKDKRFQNMAIFENANIGFGNFGKRNTENYAWIENSKITSSNFVGKRNE